jgi:hypothetical protein
MMSDATEYALFRLGKGDRKAAEKRLAALEKTKPVTEYKALTEALQSGRPARDNPQA